MKNLETILHSIVLSLALAATLPVSADEQTAQNKRADTLKRQVSDKTQTEDVMQGMEAPAAGTKPKKPEASDSTYLPYVTFDGASNPN